MVGEVGTLQLRVQSVVRRSLGLAPDSGTPLALGTTPGGDSLGHMSIVLELEREFGVRFAAHQLARLVDVDAIVKILEESGVSGPTS